jgi:hypothetical protein
VRDCCLERPLPCSVFAHDKNQTAGSPDLLRTDLLHGPGVGGRDQAGGRRHDILCYTQPKYADDSFYA